MKVMAINGSPRKNWNTDTLLKKVLDGAASAGAETEMVYLYDLIFRGCVSCMACKLRKEPRPCRCIQKDDLTEILDRIHEADAVVLGSPIYFSEVTGELRSFFERFLFQYLNYDDYSKPLSPAKKTALIFTMNIPEALFDDFGYRPLFQRYENWMKLYFGHCETLLATDTLQVKDYSRYHLEGFDAESKYSRHETVFPQDCRKAFDLGRKLVLENNKNQDAERSIYDFKVTSGEGMILDLADFRGKVVLIVNTATGCGFTSQYTELVQMYNDYHVKGLEILDIPCNQFGAQAPGTDAEIHKFCTLHYNTPFPQMRKSDVNGENQLPLYAYLKSQKGFEGFGEHPFKELLEKKFAEQDPDWAEKPDIKWNFTKFIIDREGNVVVRFEPTADMGEVEDCVKSLL